MTRVDGTTRPPFTPAQEHTMRAFAAVSGRDFDDFVGAVADELEVGWPEAYSRVASCIERVAVDPELGRPGQVPPRRPAR